MDHPPSQKPWIDRAILHRVAANVRRLRKAAGLTMKAASQRCAMARRQWQRIEAGQRNSTIWTVIRMAAALNVDVEELFRPLASIESEAAPS